eukprot:CAMPEP_0184656942 /NCGR_PEP_ID=MMETSP0308-20130426/16862_1 /TAXON_ID=38269 /ORGANISM="Gloeochaete witrockiana, Strain SAG 46.84" /LENGTH=405 /DNA_ID=CAMNT_0027094279 /DNA_START=72 /DNA_END=1286 /DNA_ORIENTATION=-
MSILSSNPFDLLDEDADAESPEKVVLKSAAEPAKKADADASKAAKQPAKPKPEAKKPERAHTTDTAPRKPDSEIRNEARGPRNAGRGGYRNAPSQDAGYAAGSAPSEGNNVNVQYEGGRGRGGERPPRLQRGGGRGYYGGPPREGGAPPAEGGAEGSGYSGGYGVDRRDDRGDGRQYRDRYQYGEGQGGYRGGGAEGYRGGYRGGREPRHEFERRSGTGHPAGEEKRHGAGRYNWGETPDTTEGQPVPPPAAEPLNTTAEGETPAAVVAPPATEEAPKEETPAAVQGPPVDPPTKGLSEYLKELEEKKAKVEAKPLRIAGEGVDNKQWNDAKPLKREEDETFGELFFSKDKKDKEKAAGGAKTPKEKGTKLIPEGLHYADTNESARGGRGGGGRGGAGFRGGRGG